MHYSESDEEIVGEKKLGPNEMRLVDMGESHGSQNRKKINRKTIIDVEYPLYSALYTVHIF